MKKLSQILLLLLLVSPIYSFAQKARDLGLELTGKITSARPFLRDNEIYFRFVIRMNFENKGREPIILIDPTRTSGTGLSEARFFSDDYSGKKKTSQKAFEPNSAKLDAFKASIQFFSEPSPPNNFTVVLDPGGSFSFEEDFEVESKPFESLLPDYIRRDFSSFPEKGPKNLQWRFETFAERSIPVDRLQLTYEFSFVPYVEDPDFLEKLNVRWKKYGQLPIGSSGTYFVKSEIFK